LFSHFYELSFLKHTTVFFNKQAIVIGPTPPGTGVIALTLFFTWSKQTSPTILSSILFIPTSIMIESFFNQTIIGRILLFIFKKYNKHIYNNIN
jgi:hypothetical protein